MKKKKYVKAVGALALTGGILLTDVPFTDALSSSMVAEAASTKVALSTTKKSIRKGKYFTLSIKNAGNKKITWSVSNKNILSIKKIGSTKVKVTGKKAGTAYVYAKVRGKTYKCKVTVKAPLELSDTSETIQVNGKFTISMNTSSSNVKWSVGNKKVAKLVRVGKNKYRVVGLKAGSTNVYAKVDGKTYKCKVVVKGTPKISSSSVSVNYGSSKSVSFKNAISGKKFRWTIGNDSIASIKASGTTVKITGRKVGTTNLYAKYDGKTYKCKVTVKKISNPKFDSSLYTVEPGSTVKLSVSGEKGSLSNWKSSNTSIATVKSGRVTGVKTGTVTISCMADGQTIKTKVQVVAKSSGNTGSTGNTGNTGSSGNTGNTGSSGNVNTGSGTGNTGNTGNANMGSSDTGNTSGNTSGNTGNTGSGNTGSSDTGSSGSGTGTSGGSSDTGNTGTSSKYTFDLSEWMSFGQVSSQALLGSNGIFTNAPISSITVTSSNVNSVEVNSITESDTAYGRRVLIGYVGRRSGSSELTVYCEGNKIASMMVSMLDNDTDYLNYLSWKESWKAEHWTSSMSSLEKLVTLAQWTLDNFDYVAYQPLDMYCYMYGQGGNCLCVTNLIIDFAKDLGLKATYHNYMSEAHVEAQVTLENGDIYWLEAGFTGTAGNRGNVSVFKVS